MSKRPRGWIFRGPSVAALRDALNGAFAVDPEPEFFVRKEAGNRITLHILSDGVVAEGGGGGGINDSHVCPGSPGCP